ncbi:condensation domain-containing protein [Vibrio sp. PP-XX7]
MVVFPLSAAQRGIWFSQQLNPNAKASVFKIGEYLEIFGTLNINIFEGAVRQTVSEIEAFQVTFIDSEQGAQCSGWAFHRTGI